MAVEVETDEGEAAAAPSSGGKRKLIIIGAAAVVAILLIGGGLYFVLGGGKGDSFMKLTIALEVQNEAMMNAIQPRMAKVIDAFQVYLRELRPSDLEGSAGIYRLKEELLRRVNVAIAPAVVDGILFKEILVQ